MSLRDGIHTVCSPKVSYLAARCDIVRMLKLFQYAALLSVDAVFVMAERLFLARVLSASQVVLDLVFVYGTIGKPWIAAVLNSAATGVLLHAGGRRDNTGRNKGQY